MADGTSAADLYSTMGIVAFEGKDYVSSQVDFQRSAMIYEANRGPESPAMIKELANLGVTDIFRGNLERSP